MKRHERGCHTGSLMGGGGDGVVMRDEGGERAEMD